MVLCSTAEATVPVAPSAGFKFRLRSYIWAHLLDEPIHFENRMRHCKSICLGWAAKRIRVHLLSRRSKCVLEASPPPLRSPPVRIRATQFWDVLLLPLSRSHPSRLPDRLRQQLQSIPGSDWV